MASIHDVQRLFLQAVFSRGSVSVKLAQTLWVKSVAAVQAANPDLDIPYSNDRASWDAFVTKVNRSLDGLDLEFRHLHDESSGKEIYAMVNRKGDEVAQLATEYSPAEIAYFKAVVDLIMLAPRESYSVSSTAALREVSAIRPKLNMTKTQAEATLGSFVANKWLVKSKQGYYSLSARSLLELLPYFKMTYPNEIIECTICMEMLTKGVACHTENCKIRMHYHCFVTFRRRQHACPSCKADWPAAHTEKPLIPVGESAARDGGSVGKRDKIEKENDDEYSESDNDEAKASQPSQPKPQRNQPKRRGRAN